MTAETPSYDTKGTIREATINTATTPLRSYGGMVCPSSGAIEMDLLLCDYVKLRKTVRRGPEKTKKTTIDKKLQKWRKGWVVITTKELLKCTLEYYKDEDHWLTPSKSIEKITICELLKDIVTVEHTHSSYKSHVMSITFKDFDILIGFKSRTTMESWITKLNNIREYFLVQLIASSNKAIDPATYLIHVQAKKIVGYNAIGSPEVVWTWDSTDLYGYRLERETIPEVEIIIGIGSAAHGNFRFIGPGLTMMCHSIKEKILSLNGDKQINEGEGAGTSDNADGKLKVCKEPSVLQINPSYGVLSILEDPEETAEENAEENAEEEAKVATTKPPVYVNDPKQDTAAVYVNDGEQGKAILEEYEYVDLSPTSTEQQQISKQQTPPYKDFESSADYENQYI